MRITKKAFTMAEVLMVLAVLGVIAAILIPSIATLKPDQNKVMFKKAYYLTERIVAETVNDLDLYPSNDSDTLGFIDYSKVLEPGTQTIVKIKDANGTEREVGSDDKTSDAAKNKLCLIFQDRLNLVSDTSVTGCQGASDSGSSEPDWSKPTFKTVDGIWWYFPRGIWAKGNEKYIWMDTNGASKKPDSRTAKKPDRFRVKVRYDGKMSVDSNSKEAEYLKAATTVNDK